MQNKNTANYIKSVLKNMPTDWLNLTTHRLDIYNEALAKTEFITELEELYQSNNSDVLALNSLPTAYDYIRLGHPLSSILEWAIAKVYNIDSKQVISFSSQTMPILAILRKNLLDNKKTLITYADELPTAFNYKLLKGVYGYNFELKQVESPEVITEFDGSLIFVSQYNRITSKHLNPNIDFQINLYENLGSILYVHKQDNSDYVSEIQHVRRRESIAMTPHDTLIALKHLVEGTIITNQDSNRDKNKKSVLKTIQTITGTNGNPLVGSSGLSVQYAIMMGLIDDAQQNYPNKAIKFIVPTNCYGGTNDQARRVAACNDNVVIVDLEVDGDNDMVSSLKTVLENIAKQDAIPYIIAEIPTNQELKSQI